MVVNIDKYGWAKDKSEDGVLYIREYESGMFRFIEYSVDEEENTVWFYTSDFEIWSFDEFFPRNANAEQRMEKAFEVVNENGPGYFTNGVELGKVHANTFDKLSSKLKLYGI